MGGSPKPQQAKASTANSVFNGVRTSNVSLPGFGTGTTNIGSDGSVNTTYNPDQQFQTILQGAKQGVQDNQSIFNLTPDQQFAQVEQNPYYQQQKLQNKLFLNQGLSDARQQAAASGLDNSTISGAMQASLLNDAALNDWNARTNAIDTSRSQAAQNMGIQQGIMDQLYNYAQQPTQLSNQTLMSAGDNQDQTSMFNAGQIQQANIQNAQMANQMAMQAAQNRSALIGNIIKAGVSIAAAPLAGGTSLIGLAGQKFLGK